MDCNKEEATRAKGIAEKKMESKDFAGARKIALKAQQLYPELDNIAQMLCVCDVHCSAEKKLTGNDKDWYRILQVDQVADEVVIKKQYRKLALLLHPDKNKFSGAEAAFKLIGEAQRVLLDKDKRSLFDMRSRAYKHVVPNRAPQQAKRNVNTMPSKPQNKGAGSTSSHGISFNSIPHPQQTQPQSGVPNGKETFWTVCPYCSVRYQYYKEVLNRALRCQSCKKPFIAYDMFVQGAGPGAAFPHHPSVPKDVPHHGTGNSSASFGPKKTTVEPSASSGPKKTTAEPSASSGPKKTTAEPFASSGPKKATAEPFARSTYSEEIDNSQRASVSRKRASVSRKGATTPSKIDKERRGGESKDSKKANGKRGKKWNEESSESSDSDSSSDSEGMGIDQDGGARSRGFRMGEDSNPRRSSRSKRRVSYNENVSDDDDDLYPSKRPKESPGASPEQEPFDLPKSTEGSPLRSNSKDSEEVLEDDLEVKSEDGGSENSKVSEPETYEYPDPDFSNFDEEKKEGCFTAGQIWAVYDTVDAMPRFYALIKKVFSPGFKLRITWLEPDPDDDDGIEWVGQDLPYSCGRFKLGQSDNTEDRPMFSHLMSWEKGSGKACFKIYPRKGETWALFKNWDINWSSNPDCDRKFGYDFVEVLSEYNDAVGLSVAYLGKLKGFASLFCQKEQDELVIPPTQILRFSHRVPSYKMTGEEREDVPKGSFELDPASISMNIEEIVLPRNMARGQDNVHSNGFSDGPSGDDHVVKEGDGRSSTCPDARTSAEAVPENHIDDDPARNKASLQDVPELPDPEFYNFDAMKSLDKFQAGQVWALYSDLDGMPKYYGLIRKVDTESGFKVHVAWLEACFLPSNMILWQDKDMPICCGRFKVKSSRGKMYYDSTAFSHQLRAELKSKNVFSIYPKMGEVWALYKNWSPEMRPSDLENCEYDIVEVVEEQGGGSQLKVSVLERVTGYNSVFKVQMIGESPLTVDISHVEYLRFSHQIPSYQLREERGGSLRGFWELDPAAVPVLLLCTD